MQVHPELIVRVCDSHAPITGCSTCMARAIRPLDWAAARCKIELTEKVQSKYLLLDSSSFRGYGL